MLFRSFRSINRMKELITHAFEKYPRLSNALTGFATFAAGDLLIQKYEIDKISSGEVTSPHLQQGAGKNQLKRVDYLRTIEVGLLGVVMNGYFLTTWYTWLDRVVGTSMKSTLTVVLKCLADQLVYAPFTIVSFFGFQTVIRYFPNNPEEMSSYFISKLKNHFWSTFFADCTVWPLANAINFRVISLVYRPTFTAVVQLLWQTYLSFVAEEEEEVEQIVAEVPGLTEDGVGKIVVLENKTVTITTTDHSKVSELTPPDNKIVYCATVNKMEIETTSFKSSATFFDKKSGDA